MKEPQTQDEIEAAAKTWIGNIVGWKRRYVEGLQNELASLRERVALANTELLDVRRKLADAKDRIRRAHAELGVP